MEGIVKSFILILLLVLPPTVFAQAGLNTKDFEGTWKSQFAEPMLAGYVNRTLVVDAAKNYTLKFVVYSGLKDEKPYFTQDIEGKVLALDKNELNPDFINMDLSITKHTVLFNKVIRGFPKACAKLGVTLDILKNGCGEYAPLKSAKKLFLVAYKMDKNSLLLETDNGFKMLPVTAEVRPRQINIFKMIRQP